MATDFACPVCGEPATFRPPINWMPESWGPPPGFSHLNGDGPCFLVGKWGNEPARPIAKSLLAPDADLPLERDRDELHERTADEPIGYEAFPPLEDW